MTGPGKRISRSYVLIIAAAVVVFSGPVALAGHYSLKANAVVATASMIALAASPARRKIRGHLWLVWVCVAWIAASAWWSIDPGATRTATGSLLLVVMTALAILKSGISARTL